MLSVKQELLAALAAELETLSPGAGARAAFENPKVAAHGDFACTAAMQLAKPLKANPRALGEQLKAALEATPAFQKWVDAKEFDRNEKVAAVTRLYNEIGIDKMAQDKIAYYFEQSKKYLDAVNVPAERKEELAKYAQKMMKRQY